MSNRFRHRAPALLPFATVLLAASTSFAGWGASNKDYGGNLNMQLYTPSTVAASPAVLVAIHYCTGNANSPHGWFDSAADKNGFFIISPDAGKQCFDSSITRAGDRADIVKMVQYVITQKNADKNRVFAAGLSSGGCMTNTLLAIYPDVFAGGSAMPGFPAGGWPAGDTTCTKCSQNPPSTTGAQWGDMARTAFAFTGTRPCVQEWVGGGDEYKFNLWLPGVAAQFQNLGGLDMGSSGTGAPNGWTRTVYKDPAGNVRLETNLGPSSQKHDLSSAGLFGNVITFLGLDKATGACGLASSGSGGSGSGSGGTSGSAGSSSRAGSSNGGAGGSPTGTAGSSTGGGGTSGAGTVTGAGGASAGSTSSAAGSPSASGAPSASAGTGAGTAGAKPTGTAGSGATSGGGSKPDEGGCSVGNRGSNGPRGALVGLLVAGLAAVVRRRRRAAV
jgi:poly(hydroxyalkanoate) depolymerase family esterase